MCHALRDSDACERFTSTKSMASNRCHALRDSDVCERFATIKSKGSNVCHTLRDGDVCERFAIIKSKGSNVCHTLRNGDSCEGGLSLKGLSPNSRNLVGYASVCHLRRDDKLGCRAGVADHSRGVVRMIAVLQAICTCLRAGGCQQHRLRAALANGEGGLFPVRKDLHPAQQRQCRSQGQG